jgi:hypothetical protein
MDFRRSSRALVAPGKVRALARDAEHRRPGGRYRRAGGTPAGFPEPSLRPGGSLQGPHQRMHNGDLVVYIGSDTGGSEIRSLRIRANPAFLAIQGGDLC